MVNKEINDKEFDDYLKGDSDLSSIYHSSSKREPANSLNEKILSAAKDAVTNDTNVNKKQFHKSPWAIPVSIAAMVTLSVSLVITMQQEVGKPLISEPESEMNASFFIVESLVPEKAQSRVGPSVAEEHEIIIEKSKLDNVPATLDASVDVYRVDDKKEEAQIKLRKDIINEELLQEGKIKEQKKRAVLKQQVISTATMRLNDSATSEMLLNKYHDELLKIKKMWQDGELSKAKSAFNKFKENNPDINIEVIEQVLGLNVYQDLNNHL